MGALDLCRKCTLFTNARLVSLLTRRHGGRENPTESLVCLYLDNDTSQDSSEVSFRDKVSSQRLVSEVLYYAVFSERTGSGGHEPVDTTEKYFLHHDVESLLQSAEGGCHLCYHIVDFARVYRHVVFEELRPEERRKMRCVPHAELYLADDHVDSSADNGPFRLAFDMIHEDTGRVLTASDDGWRLSLRPAPRAPLQSESLVYGLKRGTLAAIKLWLKSCESTHDLCNRYLVTESSLLLGLPARLLHIAGLEGSRTVKLIETSSFDDRHSGIRYATLSHCWGKEGVPNKLVRSNVESYLTGIPWQKLPRTFREAVDVAAALRLEFLWIDALCIIQDLQSDWDAEAPHMLSTYYGAVLNIAAVGSTDSEGGLLCQNNMMAECFSTVNWSNDYGISGNMRLSRSSQYCTMIDDSLLVSRAWVFQERLLSRRTIYFASDQVWWECRCERHKEFEEVSVAGERVFEHPNPHPHSILESNRWMELVAEYIQRDLTRETDRLIAISGVAELWSKKYGYGESEYAAGFWKSSINLDLLWGCEQFRVGQNAEIKPAATDDYIAPSWSWASTRCPIYVASNQASHYSDGKEIVWQPQFQIMDVSIDPASSTSYGSIKDGWLHVRSLLHPITLSKPNPEETEPFAWEPFKQLALDNDEYSCDFGLAHEFWSAYPSSEDGFIFVPDVRPSRSMPMDEPRVMSAYFIPMVQRSCDGPTHSGSPQHKYEGLVLSKKSNCEGTYSRIGVMYIRFNDPRGPSWWSASPALDENDYLAESEKGVHEIKIV